MSFLREGSVLEGFLRTRSGKFGRITRGVMTPKRAPRGWYKGVGCRSLGRFSRKGRYLVVQSKVPVFIMPEIRNFTLKPYVSPSTPKIKVPPLRLPSPADRERVLNQVREEKARAALALEKKENAQLA